MKLSRNEIHRTESAFWSEQFVTYLDISRIIVSTSVDHWTLF